MREEVLRLVKPTRNRVKVLFAVAACLSASALARDKTDVLFMNNGDRITCEVKRLEGGILEIGLDYVDGNISVSWEKVARIESSYLFVVQLTDGSTFAGQVIKPEVLAGAAKSLLIREVGNVEPTEVPQDEVARMTQASVSFLNRFNGGVTLGSQYAKGNNTTQYNFTSDLGYEETKWAAKVRYSSNLSSSTGTDPATRNQLDFSGYHLARRKNLFYAGSAGYLQSSVQGIESQASGGGGLGLFVKNTPQTRLSLLAGAGVQNTRYSSSAGQADQSLAVAIFSSTLEIFQFKRTHLQATGTVSPALNDIGRFFGRTNAAYYLKLLGKFDLNFSFYGNWDSRPPEGFQKSDYGTSTGISYTFGNR